MIWSRYIILFFLLVRYFAKYMIDMYCDYYYWWYILIKFIRLDINQRFYEDMEIYSIYLWFLFEFLIIYRDL